MTLYFFRRNQGRVVWFWEVAQEVGVANHLVKIGTCLGVTQETF